MQKSLFMSMEEVISLCKRKGFVFQSSDIYGGMQGVYDYGPLGIELKNHLKAAWWRSIIYERDDVEGLDSSILTHRLTLNHSGHEDTFTDPMVDCKECKKRFRADHLLKGQCENCGSSNLTDPRPFNLMFKTNIGPIADGKTFAYLRPETAQGIFINFKNVLSSTSRKIPFGIAQIGKAFRNEVTPKNFLFRVREFEQMELEFFVEPGTDEKWHKHWVEARKNWWIAQGIKEENLILQAQTGDELAHYAKATIDILFRFPHGFEELEGVANRADFDLGSHSKQQEDLNLKAHVEPNTDSNARLNVEDLKTKKEYVPYVIEPSAGVDRGVMAILVSAFEKEVLDNGTTRTLLRLKPHLAPVKVAIVPLARNNEKIVAKAKEIKQSLQALGLGRIKYEDTGNVGKAYRRNDEIGTPICITVDFDTFEGKTETVTLRDRDSMKQKRVPIPDLSSTIREYFLCETF